MTKDDVIRMAEEAGIWWQEYEGRICPDRLGAGDFEQFAKLVADAERERCAQLCEKITASTTVELVGKGFADEIRALK